MRIVGIENLERREWLKSVFSDMVVRFWLIISAIAIFTLIFATLFSVLDVTTYNLINATLGGERQVLVSGDPSQNVYYSADVASKDEAIAYAEAINESIATEGIILLKNDDGVLPLSKSAKISVFGKNSVNMVYGGSGSSSGNADDEITIYESLESAGFRVNPMLKNFYDDNNLSGDGRGDSPSMSSGSLAGFAVGETPYNNYTDEVKASYSSYDDVALVVFSRIGGEGFDLPRTMMTDFESGQKIDGARNADDHYLQLDQNETDLIKGIENDFDNIIIIINTLSQAFEVGFLSDESHYAYSDSIKGAFWVGGLGETGINAFGKILSGESNPSARTVDTFSYDFKNDPAWQNFGSNLTADGNIYQSQTHGSEIPSYFVDYEEGIYVGYRYYETRSFTENAKVDAVHDEWYDDNVVYPFGYGLSYTTFEQTISSVNIESGSILSADDTIEVTVNVTNTGDYDGKEVVQIYYTAPYYDGEIEKAHVIFGGFAKTDILKANGGQQEVTVSISARDMASYDYSDANGNGFKGYELEEGEYEIKLMQNAHDVIDSITYNVSSGGIKYSTDSKTGQTIENLFDDVTTNEKSVKEFMSRADFEGTFPTMPTEQDRQISDEFLNSLVVNINDDDAMWESNTMPSYAGSSISLSEAQVQLYEMITKDYDDENWDILVGQLTLTQMQKLIGDGCYSTIAIDGIGKPGTISADGPVGFTSYMGGSEVYDTHFYASETVLGSTYNVELAFDKGESIGNESLIGNEKGDGKSYSGWYAPAVNIHRSQFGGRNWEYVSEDGLLSGKIASGIVQGAKSKGVNTYTKHFALNEQETDRENGGVVGGLITWSNEQAMRELYFVPFEIVVKEGETYGIMSSFNRIGTNWTGGSYALLTQLLRDEWGFEGAVITDYNTASYVYMDLDLMIRAGGDISLSGTYKVPTIDESSATQVTAMARACKNILFAVANSNAMNGYGQDVVYKTALPIWLIVLIVIDVVVLIGLGVVNYIVIRLRKRKLDY